MSDQKPPQDEGKSRGQPQDLHDEISRLRGRLRELEQSSSSMVYSIAGLDTLLLRIDNNNIIHYVNTALATYLNVAKEDLVGQDAGILQRLFPREIHEAIVTPGGELSPLTIISDNKGRTFEIKISVKGGLRDVVMQDITDEERFKNYVRKYIPLDFYQLTAEDLHTFKYPERRYMTVSFTDLRGFTAMSESLSPEEVRQTMNAYLEEILHAIAANSAMVDKIMGDEVMVLYGAPKYHRDHALRAIKTACDQMFNLKQLQRNFARMGKTMPQCGIGINTGDMVIGNIGGATRQDYTVIGSSVNLAARLCGAAWGTEIILTEETLLAALEAIPKGWQTVTSIAGDDRSIGERRGKTEGVVELPADLKGKVICIGPNIKDNPDNVEYCFRYLHSVRIKGVPEPLPVISVERPGEAASTLELDDDRIDAVTGEYIFGKYRLTDFIGRGGMGEVWKSRDKFGNIVAIKTLVTGEAASLQQINRLKREAQVMSQLQHRGICHIHEIGEADNLTYIAMEFLQGVSLAEILNYKVAESTSDYTARNTDIKSLVEEIESDKSSAGDKKEIVKKDTEVIGLETAKSITKNYRILPLQQTLATIVKICDAIQYAHEHGIFHRDLKPGNIMIRSDGEPVVMDFGLAKLEAGTPEMTLTVSGQIMGTIEYMAPEQAMSSKDIDEHADVYSIGAILYQLVTGRKHFSSSGNILTDAHKLQDYTPIKPKELNRQIEGDLEVVILKALASDPQERYRSAAALRDDLERYRRGETIAAKPATLGKIFWKTVKRNKALSITIAATIIIIVGLTVASFVLINEQKNLAQKRLRESLDGHEITKLHFQLVATNQEDIGGLVTNLQLIGDFLSANPGNTKADSLLERRDHEEEILSQHLELAMEKNEIAPVVRLFVENPDFESVLNVLDKRKGSAGLLEHLVKQLEYNLELPPPVGRGQCILDTINTLLVLDPANQRALAARKELRAMREGMPVIYFEDFEHYSEGERPEDWQHIHHEGVIGMGSGSKAIIVNSTYGLTGKIVRELTYDARVYCLSADIRFEMDEPADNQVLGGSIGLCSRQSAEVLNAVYGQFVFSMTGKETEIEKVIRKPAVTDKDYRVEIRYFPKRKTFDILIDDEFFAEEVSVAGITNPALETENPKFPVEYIQLGCHKGTRIVVDNVELRATDKPFKRELGKLFPVTTRAGINYKFTRHLPLFISNVFVGDVNRDSKIEVVVGSNINHEKGILNFYRISGKPLDWELIHSANLKSDFCIRTGGILDGYLAIFGTGHREDDGTGKMKTNWEFSLLEVGRKFSLRKVLTKLYPETTRGHLAPVKYGGGRRGFVIGLDCYGRGFELFQNNLQDPLHPYVSLGEYYPGLIPKAGETVNITDGDEENKSDILSVVPFDWDGDGDDDLAIGWGKWNAYCPAIIQLEEAKPTTVKFLTDRVGATHVAVSKLNTSNLHLIAVSEESRVSQGGAIEGCGLRVWRMEPGSEDLIYFEKMNCKSVAVGEINGREVFAVLKGVFKNQQVCDFLVQIYDLQNDKICLVWEAKIFNFPRKGFFYDQICFYDVNGDGRQELLVNAGELGLFIIAAE
ncbi:protein kinase [Planctomycetota bacterium]